MAKPYILLAIIVATQAWGDAQTAVSKARLPEGLQLNLFADGISRARSLDVADDGTVAVGTASNSIHLLRDDDGDGKAETRFKYDKLSTPNGVAWHGKDLYIAEISRVLLMKNALEQLRSGDSVKLEPVIVGLPTSSHHGRRVIDFSPDGKLFIALGVPCNICEPPDTELTGTIREHDLASGSSETYAYGFRNSVGFDWHPVSGELWATDNGRDWLGDDAPHDELNRVAQGGLHFGFPYCHQGDLADPQFGSRRSCAEFTPPALNLGPHVAALGIHITNAGAPIAPNSAIIALHGSWNRSDPIGYEVIQVNFDASGKKITFMKTFIGGWLEQGSAIARPVDVASLTDGSLLVSDDYNNAVYRVSKIPLQ